MSRSSHQRQQQKLQQQQQLLAHQQQMTENDAAAAAAEMFDLFCVATTMRQVLGLHRNMCDLVGLRPAPLNEFYPKLKAKIRSWKAQALWKKFDARAAHRVYAKATAATGTRVLVIGAGPCGMRTAIEAQLLGAKVVVVEKRDRISRNNVLHLWPFVITDLRNLGAKKFYGKFCAGSIDHISIRQLQCILLKVALLLGVEVHEGVSFDGTIEPNGDGCGWRAAVSPVDHVVSHYEFDVLIGADGKRNTLEGFKRKEFRGKLAIAITANFINKKTEAEAKAEEISGVAFIFNQSFFKELYHTTGIDLENIVYYKDETHYFVMTAKKHSLIDKGVIMQDFADPAELLAPANVNTEKLLDYAREAAEFSTKYQMPNLEFAVNHYGKPDVAMFDFTSMFAAETSCRVIVRKSFRLLQCLVGDSLLEPFWPTGSGCARGFLSSMDAAYAIKLWSNPQNSSLGVLAQRESIYRLLNQTTPENLQRDTGSYTVDPATRYPNLNRTSVNVWQVKHLIDTDDNAILEQTFMDTNALQGTQVDTPVRRKRRSGDSTPLSTVLLRWICSQLHSYEFTKSLQEVSDVFTNGKVLCALINRYRPDLVDVNAIKDLSPVECNDIAFKVLEKELNIPRVMTGREAQHLSAVESKIWLNYLEQICEVFRGEIPHVKHPKMDFSELREKYRFNTNVQPDFSKLLQKSTKPRTKNTMQDMVDTTPQTDVVQRRTLVDGEDKSKRQRKHIADGTTAAVTATSSGGALQPGQGETPRRAKKRRSAEKAANISSKVALAFKKQAASEKCHFCKQTVYLMEKINTEGLILHRSCLKCHHCHTNLRPGGYAFDRDDPNGRFYCTQHFRLPAKAIRPVVRKPGQRKPTQQQQSISAPSVQNILNVDDADVVGEHKTLDKLRVHTDSVAQLDLLDRGQTPERIEFENTDAMSDGEPSEEHIIDENEWSGRNFLPESNKDSESDLSSSEESDSDMFEEANDSPLAVQTLQLATDWIGKQNYSDSDDFDDFYDSSDGVVDDGKDDTEGEEFKKARELRREEVRLLPLPANLPTDTETEVQSDSESLSSDKVEQNSATEISTDSEFDHDEIIRETPKIFIDDTHLRKPTKVHVKSTIISPSSGQKYHTATPVFVSQTKGSSYLQKYQPHNQPLQPQFKPLVQVDPSVLCSNRMPLENPRPGDYFLNKTASTEGIASKKSLELKKRYLLGEQANGNKIQKSGSTSVLDSKIRSFHSNISECQKLLNPGNDKTSRTKTFLDQTKLGKTSSSDTTNVAPSATGNILKDLKVEITIQKASSNASTDNEKENLFVNSKNELNKGMEYSETVNSTLVESLGKKSPTTPTNNQKVIETIDLVTPEKKIPIIDLTQVEIPTKMLESNAEFIKHIEVLGTKNGTTVENCCQLLNTDSNKIIDLTCHSPVESDKTVIEGVKPDISIDVKECIPDIIEHIEGCDGLISVSKNQNLSSPNSDEQHRLLSYSYDEEKKDSPEKLVALDNESHDLQIEVPNIPWNTRKPDNSSSNSLSSCSSNTSSIEDIQHFILESTTSPDTQTANGLGVHQVPRLEVHDTSGELMQIDSLMIIDGRYIGDPEDLKLLEIPEGLIIPELPAIQTSEVEDEPDIEPVTATPEPAEGTIIEAEDPKTLPLSDSRQPIMQPFDLKFDSRNENKVETLKNLPLIVEQAGTESCKAVKPLTLNLKNAHKSTENPTTPTMNAATPKSPLIDNDKTPTAALVSRGSDSETEATGTGQVLTETELSDWTADDCISENFIDIEFVLNSNKGTIKRNKKGGKKKVLSAYKELSMGKPSSKVATDCQKIAPVAEFEGILRNLDIDEIEFMDTGSEGSCADAYSATNSAMLRNRGYMEFIETTPKKIPSHKTTENVQKLKDPLSVNKYKEIPTKRDEVLGIDYIEQGAYIMTSGNSLHDLLKTPVNEQPILSISVDRSERSSLSQPQITLSQSLTDSSTLNDLEDDSLGVVTNSGANTKTTTDESEALTVVTSPLDSSSPKIAEVFVSKGIPSTPSSSDKNPKTSTLSTYSPTTASTASFSNTTSPRLSAAQEKIGTAVATKMESVSIHQPTSDEICYEDYVRALQQKITQISNARDSLDTRKQRRKSSKGEAPLATFSSDTQTVIEQQIRTASGESSSQSLTPPRLEAAATSIKGIEDVPESSTWLAQLHKVPEIPTLTSRLEEITKERTKQKDLIHDLVMDKLQSKKQLNAEKRLHRSRQRSMLAAGGCGYTSGSSLSPTPKLAAASTTTDTNCTSQAHYHVSTSAPTAPKERPTLKEHSSSSSFKENKPLQKSSSYVAAYCTDSAISPPCSAAYTQRPFSEHLDAEQLDALECYKLVKTPSFSYAMSASRRNLNSEQSNKEDKKQISNSTLFATPTAPLHGNRERSISGCSLISPTLNVNEEHLDVGVSVISTEKLRTEARARARLKSNNELGLSPEEKILLLRKRLNLENIVPMETRQNYAKSAERDVTHGRSGYDLKMSSSKSVNDLVTAAPFSGKIHGYAADENSNTTQSAVMADFTSDPNLLLSSTTAQTAIVKPSKGDDKITRRQKDPERRKSIIQSLSNFFHMGNGSSGANGGKNSSSNSGSAANSAQPERPGTCGSSTTSSSVEGVFSRFRIAPKLKEKSKDKDAGATVSVTSRDNTISTTTNVPTPTKHTHYERSSSQDCILNTQTNNDSSHRYSNTTKQSNYSHNQHQHHHHHHHHHHRYHNNNNNGNKQHLDSSASAKHFASSPQLFVNPFTVVTPDELTPPPIPPLPLHYQRSDDESYATETREQKKQRSISKAVRQAELKRLRIAQEIQREQEEIEVQLKELEARGVLIEKALRGEGQHVDSLESSNLIGANDEKLLKQLLEIWRNITQLKKRDEELSIRQQELQLEHRHAQLKEELNMRLSSSKLDKSSADVAAEGAILNEMLEIVAKRASLRPTTTTATSPSTADKQMISKQHEASAVAVAASGAVNTDMEATNSAETTRSESLKLTAIDGAQSLEMNESHI